MKSLLSLLLCSVAAAQIVPSRNMFVEPRADSGAARGLLGRTAFFGEMSRGFGSAGDDRAWDATIGGAAEIYRWNESAALQIRFAEGLFANALPPDFPFKPRSMQFEENMSGLFRAGGFDIEAGMTYRCKHDVDNTDLPTTSVTPPIDSVPQKRVLIFAGPFGVVTSAPWLLSRNVTLRAIVRTEFFLVHEDNRFPANADGMLLSNAINATTLGVRLDASVTSSMLVYSREWVSAIICRGPGPNTDASARAEVGLRFPGFHGGIDAFAAFEHLFDDLSVPVPRRSNVVAVGLRVN
jgi:hypothetical protein